MEEVEREGVSYEPSQLAYRAWVQGPSGTVFEDYFGDGESAALVRELVIVVRGLDATRNFALLSAEEICERLHRELVARDLAGLPEALRWLAAVPMTEAAFRAPCQGPLVFELNCAQARRASSGSAECSSQASPRLRAKTRM